MKKAYVSPDLELKTFILKDVILSSIIDNDENYQGGGVVVIGDEEEEIDGL